MSQPISPSSRAFSGTSPLAGASNDGMAVTQLPPTTAAGKDFQNLFLEALGEANRLDGEAQAAVAQGLAGGELTQAEVLTSVRKADLALRMMIQVRNKLLDAYREVQQMRM